MVSPNEMSKRVDLRLSHTHQSQSGWFWDFLSVNSGSRPCTGTCPRRPFAGRRRAVGQGWTPSWSRRASQKHPAPTTASPGWTCGLVHQNWKGTERWKKVSIKFTPKFFFPSYQNVRLCKWKLIVPRKHDMISFIRKLLRDDLITRKAVGKFLFILNYRFIKIKLHLFV